MLPCEVSSASTPQPRIDPKKSKFNSSRMGVFPGMYKEGPERPEDLGNW